MYIGIERTTDCNHPEYKFRKFKSAIAAIKWAENSGDFAWPGAARDDIPPSQQNFHRRFRSVYELPYMFRVKKKELSKMQGTGYYSTSRDEALYSYYLKYRIRDVI
jgi:hypothetical protein